MTQHCDFAVCIKLHLLCQGQAFPVQIPGFNREYSWIQFQGSEVGGPDLSGKWEAV